MPILKLHANGRYLQDSTGKNVLLHGSMQPSGSWFNGEGHNFAEPTDFTNPTNVAPALNFFNAAADIFSKTDPQYGQSHGWGASFVRFIGDDGGVSNFAPGWDVNGNLVNAAQFNGWINNILVPYVNHCAADGLYVVVCGNPSVAYPGGDTTKNMTRQYQQNLIAFWQAVASTAGIKSANNVMFEICNEPIAIETSFGKNDWRSGSAPYWSALTNFMQPVVDAIRNTGADNVILVPGLGYQGEYQGFVPYPVTGSNIGYAAHLYPAYGSVHNNATAVQALWNSNYKPAANFAPMVITEMYWYLNDGVGYIDLFNGTTAGFGNAAKTAIDGQGNVSYLVGMIGDLLANLNSGLGATTLNTQDGSLAAFAWWSTYSWAVPVASVSGGATGHLVNISSRAFAEAGDKVAIGGFVVNGTSPKRLLLRAVGPTLTTQGIPSSEAMADPTIELHDALHNNAVIATDDNWSDNANASDTTAAAAQFGATALAGNDAKSAALLLTVQPGVYTFIAAGKNGTSGIVLIEVYDADSSTNGSTLVNISTRAYCATGDNVTIGGFVVAGNAPKHLLLRAVGPTLTTQGVASTEVLQDPTIEVHDALHNNVVIATNDNWGDNPNQADIVTAGARIGATPLASGDTTSSALLITLKPGIYSFVAQGKGGSSGIVLLEVYDAD